jgi:Uma2 family endonuclease
MATVLEPPKLKSLQTPAVPPLEQGAFLDTTEFLRRYDSMPDLKKAELIDGIVNMGSPVSVFHARPDQIMQVWLGVYSTYTPPLQTLSNITTKFDERNVAQPDLLLHVPAEFGGVSTLSSEGFVVGPPELIIEIAATTASIDLNRKLRLYERFGVREYIVWTTLESAIQWFVLVDSKFQLLDPEQGLLRSRHFSGLALDVNAALNWDGLTVLKTVEREMNSQAHRDFVSSFQKKS